MLPALTLGLPVLLSVVELNQLGALYGILACKYNTIINKIQYNVHYNALLRYLL
jgi:hypothetical protein